VKYLAEIFLGTSGWSYKEWVGPFYSNDKVSKLHAYSEVFGTAEIDSTYYAYPKKGMPMGWKMNTPTGFVFTAKLPKVITHDKRLDLTLGVEEDLRRFVDVMSPLATSDKLGCLLIQLPPSYGFDLGGLESFLKILPKNVRFAVEFRNLSWMREETWPLLERYRVAYTNVDEPLLPPEIHVTTDFSYFRWHGRGSRIWFDYGYKKEELEQWIPKVKETSERVKTIFGYFNNHYHGYAVENCLQVMRMLGTANDSHTLAEKRIMEFRINPSGSRASNVEEGQGSLDHFIK
jgi:uncharacterized protein YecE (DUF72 family)